MQKFYHLTGMSSFTPVSSLVQDPVKMAKKYGMDVIGLTDDTNLYGMYKYAKKAKSEGIKFIIGTTLNVCYLNDHTDFSGDNVSFPMKFIVMNETGFLNLNKLITTSQTEGRLDGESSSKPKIHYKTILENSEGLIALTGGYQGLFNNNINRYGKLTDEMEAILIEFAQTFGEHFYIEIQNHNITSELEVNFQLLKLKEQHSLKAVFTHDYKYNYKGSAFPFEVVKSIANNRTLNRDFREYVMETYMALYTEHQGDEEAFYKAMDSFYAQDTKFLEFLEHGNSFHFASSEEILTENANLFEFYPELISNLEEINQKVNFELDLDNPELPNYPLPEGFDNDEAFFRHLVTEGFQKRLPFILKMRDKKRFPTADSLLAVYTEQLKYETDMISKMGFPGYFLVVWDVCNYARQEGVYMAPGRGSVAGSLVAFALEITGIDPVAKGLLFERFLNPARVSMPDIDLDFDSQYRGKILEYTYRKYGAEYVAQIIAFTTEAAKPAIADTGKTLNIVDQTLGEKYVDTTDYVKKFINSSKDINENIQTNEELQELRNKNILVRFLLDVAKEIEGIVKSTSMHAGGVVIGKRQIAKYIPFQKAKTKKQTDLETGEENVLEGVVIQADKKACEPLGLIKMDYLATAILSKVRLSLNYINRGLVAEGKKPIDFYELSDYVQYATAEQDPKMYNVLQSGKTLMVFQCENPALGNTLTQFYPETFEDVTAILALYRPGPMANIPTYIANKNNPESIDWMHEDLRPVLQETFGIIVYQEQIMQLVQVWAGFSLAEADLIRRAIGKKEPEALKAEGEKFVNKAVAMGRDRELSEKLYALILKFAEYGFNKSHAAAYAVLCLVTAWLKAYYPVEYTAYVINSFSTASQKKTEAIANFLLDLQDAGYEVLPPSVNKSEYLFTVEEVNGKKALRHGLFAIKDTSEKGLTMLVNERKTNGDYKDLHDFFSRNVKVIEREDKEEGFVLETVDKSTVDSLSITGAFEEISGATPKVTLGENAKKIIDFYKKEVDMIEKSSRSAQLDLFATMDDNYVNEPNVFNFAELGNIANDLFVDFQNEMSKMRLTYKRNDLLSAMNPMVRNRLTLRSDFDKLNYEYAGTDKKPHLHQYQQEIICYGTIQAKRELAKYGMCFITFRDHTGIIETTVFKDVYSKVRFFLDENENKPLVFKGFSQVTKYGKFGHESSVYNLNITAIYTLDEVTKNPALLGSDISLSDASNVPTTKEAPKVSSTQNIGKLVHIKVDESLPTKDDLRNFLKTNNRQNGEYTVAIHNYANGIKKNVFLAQLYRIDESDISNLVTSGLLTQTDVFY